MGSRRARHGFCGFGSKSAISLPTRRFFSEAGIGLAAVTFSSAAIHAALNIWSRRARFPSVFQRRGRTDGSLRRKRSEAALFGGVFLFARTRALSVARAELRLSPNFLARPLREELPSAPKNASPMAYAAALSGSAPLGAKIVNFLPRERRVEAPGGSCIFCPHDSRGPHVSRGARGLSDRARHRTEALPGRAE